MAIQIWTGNNLIFMPSHAIDDGNNHSIVQSLLYMHKSKSKGEAVLATSIHNIISVSISFHW